MSHVDPSLCCFAAEAILKRLENVLRLIEPVQQDQDVEAVHDMRVASRRARTALRLFEACFAQAKVRQWNRRLRQVTRTLGEARDADVQIQFVKGFLKRTKDTDLRPGLRRLLLRLGQRRARLQTEVVRTLHRFGSHRTLGEMRAALLQAKAHGYLYQLNDRAEAVYRHAEAAISSRLEEVLSFEEYVSQPECVEQLHAMRIAAKQLRYAMEIFSPLYDGGLDVAIAAAKEVQRRLGEIHDCDVWVASLPRFVERERRRTVKYFGREGPIRRLLPGIDHLRKERHRERETCHRVFVEFWGELAANQTWESLLLLVKGPRGECADAGDSPVDHAESQP